MKLAATRRFDSSVSTGTVWLAPGLSETVSSASAAVDAGPAASAEAATATPRVAAMTARLCMVVWRRITGVPRLLVGAAA